jgi:hypothetical protein
MRTAVRKGNVAAFSIFFRNRVVLKVERRSVGPNHCVDPGTNRPDRTRLDERPCATIM